MTFEGDLLLVMDFDGSWTVWPMEGNSHWSRMDNHILTPEQLRMTVANRAHYMEVKKQGRWSEQHEIEWLGKSIKAWVDAKLTRQHITGHFCSNDGHMRRGHREMLERLKDRPNGRTYVVVSSYGIRDIIRRILQSEGVLHLVDEIVAMDLTYDADGYVTGIDDKTLVTWRIKQLRTLEIMKRLGIPDLRTVGIGDTPGDANIVPDTAHRIMIASSDEHEAMFRQHFHESVVSPHDWSGVHERIVARFAS